MSETQLQLTSQPRDIPYSPSRKLASSYSLPNHVSTDYFMRNHFLAISRRTSISLSFSNIDFDSERTIIIYSDDNNKGLVDGEQRVNEESQPPSRFRESKASGERSTEEKSPLLLNLHEIPTRMATQSETRVFFSNEMSEYLMVSTEEGEGKRTVSNGGCGNNQHSLSKDASDDTPHSEQDNTGDDDQTDHDVPPINSRAWTSRAWTSTASVNNSQTSQLSSGRSKLCVHMLNVGA